MEAFLSSVIDVIAACYPTLRQCAVSGQPIPGAVIQNQNIALASSAQFIDLASSLVNGLTFDHIGISELKSNLEAEVASAKHDLEAWVIHTQEDSPDVLKQGADSINTLVNSLRKLSEIAGVVPAKRTEIVSDASLNALLPLFDDEFQPNDAVEACNIFSPAFAAFAEAVSSVSVSHSIPQEVQNEMKEIFSTAIRLNSSLVGAVNAYASSHGAADKQKQLTEVAFECKNLLVTCGEKLEPFKIFYISAFNTFSETVKEADIKATLMQLENDYLEEASVELQSKVKKCRDKWEAPKSFPEFEAFAAVSSSSESILSKIETLALLLPKYKRNGNEIIRDTVAITSDAVQVNNNVQACVQSRLSKMQAEVTSFITEFNLATADLSIGLGELSRFTQPGDVKGPVLGDGAVGICQSSFTRINKSIELIRNTVASWKSSEITANNWFSPLIRDLPCTVSSIESISEVTRLCSLVKNNTDESPINVVLSSLLSNANLLTKSLASASTFVREIAIVHGPTLQHFTKSLPIKVNAINESLAQSVNVFVRTTDARLDGVKYMESLDAVLKFCQDIFDSIFEVQETEVEFEEKQALESELLDGTNNEEKEKVNEEGEVKKVQDAKEEMKEDVKEVKEDVKEVKEDVKEVNKEDLKEVKEDMQEVNKEVEKEVEYGKEVNEQSQTEKTIAPPTAVAPILPVSVDPVAPITPSVQNAKEWTVEEVCNWLTSRRFGHCVAEARKLKINGQCLIHSDIAILTSDLGVRLKMRKAFKMAVESIRT